MKKTLKEVAPQSARAAVPGASMRVDDFKVENDRLEHLNLSLAPTLAERSLRSLPASQPLKATSVPQTRVTKMISTPIDVTLRKMLRDLRNDHEISEGFTVETALREYFRGRSPVEIATDLRERGGCLRRSKS